MFRYALLLLILLTSSAISFAQAKEITRDEFSTTYYSALDKAQEIARRQISKRESYKTGKVDSVNTWTYEFIPPFRHRIAYEKSTGTASTHAEEVRIEGDSYCRTDSKPWVKSGGTCIDPKIRLQTQSVFQVLGKVSSDYTAEKTVENGKELVIYREYTKYKNTVPTNPEPDKLWFAENRFWLNGDGLIVRQEIKQGVTGSPQIRSDWIDTYDYEPSNLQIEAPIN
jgi:hypothetical protein